MRFQNNKMKKTSLQILTLCILLLVYNSCTKNNYEVKNPPPPITCDTVTVAMSYTIHVKPILVSKCGTLGCHSTASKFGLTDLSNWAGVNASAVSGQLLSSIIWDGKVNVKMPYGEPKLDDCAIAQIRTWIKQGAKDN